MQQVVLNHVSGRTDAVVVTGTPADTNVLGHCDLHVVDVVGVPKWLIHLVGKTQSQDVLHGLFAEVVIDAENRVCREHRFDNVVQLASGL